MKSAPDSTRDATSRAGQAARFLLAARRTQPGPSLPAPLRPQNEAEAYAIQALLITELGPIGGWKVGAAGPTATPSCAPMPQSGLHHAPAQLPSTAFTTRDVESEIAFILSRDLPPGHYTESDIIAAIASCHPGIEVLQSSFSDSDAQNPLCNLADLIRHGAYILGPAIPNWQSIDFTQLSVHQTINGQTLSRTANPAGPMPRLLTWLANTGAAWAGGLKAGQILTCGSWTGKTACPPGAHITTQFGSLPPITLEFTA